MTIQDWKDPSALKGVDRAFERRYQLMRIIDSWHREKLGRPADTATKVMLSKKLLELKWVAYAEVLNVVHAVYGKLSDGELVFPLVQELRELNAELMIDFREEDHTYWHDGKRVPGVTSALEPFAKDYAGIPEDVLRQAQERGTAVHLATAYYDLGVLDESELDYRLLPYLNAWKRFKTESGFIHQAVEMRVFSRRHWYAGTLDRIGQMRDDPYGVTTVLDIKTGSALRPITGAQIAAYAHAAGLEMARHKRIGVELHADETYSVVTFTDKNDFAIFLAALTLYNWREQHAKH